MPVVQTKQVSILFMCWGHKLPALFNSELQFPKQEPNSISAGQSLQTVLDESGTQPLVQYAMYAQVSEANECAKY